VQPFSQARLYVQAKHAMDKNTLESLRRVVLYSIIEEGRHFEESGKPRNHIWRHLMTVAKWLDTQAESQN
jgi:hypothetical protein